MSSIVDDLKYRFKSGDILTRLIFINVGIYLIFVVLNIFTGLFSASGQSALVHDILYPFLSLNSNILSTLFKPWTLITHQFIHSMSPWHIIGNMMLLYFLGKIFLNYFSQKQLLALYLMGGLMGAFSLLLLVNLSPYFQSEISAIGASAAVMAVAIAVTAYSPKTPIYLFGMFKVQLQWIGLALVISDFLFFYDGNTGGHIAHLGGALTGFWFANSIRKGKDITKGINTIIDRIVGLFKAKSKLKVEYSKSARDLSDEDYNYYKNATQEEIDAILDKISSSGYESLSKKEKEMLFKHSNK